MHITIQTSLLLCCLFFYIWLSNQSQYSFCMSTKLSCFVISCTYVEIKKEKCKWSPPSYRLTTLKSYAFYKNKNMSLRRHSIKIRTLMTWYVFEFEGMTPTSLWGCKQCSKPWTTPKANTQKICKGLSLNKTKHDHAMVWFHYNRYPLHEQDLFLKWWKRLQSLSMITCSIIMDM